jgi:hypothetical protein
MKLIAHRGLINGPNRSLENQPQQIRSSLALGYDCEIDLWVFDGRLYLGHDGPQYNITREFLDQPGLWIHAKHIDALDWLLGKDLNYFWHQEDHYTLTSKHYIWAYPGYPVTQRSVQVMPETADSTLNNLDWHCHAICSDWILKIQAQRP